MYVIRTNIENMVKEKNKTEILERADWSESAIPSIKEKLKSTGKANSWMGLKEKASLAISKTLSGGMKIGKLKRLKC